MVSKFKVFPGLSIACSPVQAAVKRGPLLRIEGSASKCPQALGWVLDRLLVLGGTPVSMDYRVRPRSVRFVIDITGITVAQRELIAARLSAIPVVSNLQVRAVRS